MIIKKTWITWDKKRNAWGNYTEKKWYGYFLFGIIPLYINNFNTKY